MFKKKKKYYRKKAIFRVEAYGGKVRRKRSSGVKKIIKILLVLAVVIAAIYGINKGYQALQNSSASEITSIEIKGTQNITQAEIRELLPFDIGDSLLAVNLSKTERDIKDIKPEIKNIKIYRGWKKVKIKVYERVPEAFIVSSGTMLGVDYDNKPFPLRAFSSAAQVPVIRFVDAKDISTALRFLKFFKPLCKEFITKIKEVKADGYKDIYFTTDDGILVCWGDGEPEKLKTRFEKFEKIYEDIKQKNLSVKSVDMSYYEIGRAVVKLKK